MGTMDKVRILEGVILVAYTAADLAVFWHSGYEPATLTACVIGESGMKTGSWDGSSPQRKKCGTGAGNRRTGSA